MPRTFDHHLHIVLPRLPSKLTQSLQLRKLRLITSIGHRPRPQPVPQRITHVILRHHLSDSVEVLIQKVLLMMRRHPLRHNRASAAHNTRNPLRHHWNVLHQHARMNREVVHPLLRLLLNHLQVKVNIQILHPLHPPQRLIQRHRPDRHRRVPQNRLPDHRNIPTRRQIHHRIRTKMHSGMQLLQLLIHIRHQRRVANIRVDLAQALHANAHRLQLRMIDICRDNHRPLRNLRPHQLRRQLLLVRHKRHLFRDQPLTRKVHLAHVPVTRPRRLFLALHHPLPPRLRNPIPHLNVPAITVRRRRQTVIQCAHKTLASPTRPRRSRAAQTPVY